MVSVMRVSQAIAKTNQEIKEVLCHAGLLIGETLTLQDIEIAENVIAWEVQIKTKQASAKDIYLLWNIISVDALAGADDEDKFRLAYVAIDLYSRKPKSHKVVEGLLSAIDDSAHEMKWRLEISNPADYDDENRMYHLSFELTKKID
jgi:hypothetical protein